MVEGVRDNVADVGLGFREVVFDVPERRPRSAKLTTMRVIHYLNIEAMQAVWSLIHPTRVSLQR